MPVEAINSNNNAKNSNLLKTRQPSFTGAFNPVVTVMDAIDRGGFAASFIAQDGIGMVAPRIYEGLNRNREKDENGKKTGPLNWEFARREGIREVLSGPSAFLIPMGLLAIIKRVSGTANNVHVSHINALGGNFAEYAAAHREQLSNSTEFKKGYYRTVFENVLHNSTDKTLTGEELKAEAGKFADRLIEAEGFRANKNKKSANKVLSELTEDFMKLRKASVSPSADNTEVIMNVSGKDLHSGIDRVMQSLSDYTNDALEKTKKFVDGNASGDIKEFVKKFNLHRSGTRVVANLGMWSAVVGFYALIPKLYNIGLKHDPGLKGLETQEKDDKSKKDVAFTGGFSKIGESAIKEGRIGSLLKNFEFNGASMPIEAMLTLLFGFTLPTRYANAKSDKERKEILVRDISSFTAILFAAKALSRGFSKAFSKLSGLALNITPADHSKGLFNKFKNYFTAGHGIEVLNSGQIVSKYSNINDYKEGINGFFKFLQENGGDVKKVLNIDAIVKEKSDAIMKRFGNGKSLKDATIDEIHEAFRKAKGSTELNKIYEVFSSTDNKFINRAKTFNSAFGFASTLILVPAFMMWLARYCERMTKKAVAKEHEAMKLKNNIDDNKNSKVSVSRPLVLTSVNQPTMAGFLNNANS